MVADDCGYHVCKKILLAKKLLDDDREKCTLACIFEYDVEVWDLYAENFADKDRIILFCYFFSCKVVGHL